MPYTNQLSCKQTQHECPDLRRVFAHLGTRPSRKSNDFKTVKRYLQRVTIGPGGLLKVKKPTAYNPELQLTVIPTQMGHGLITALHLRLQHPTHHQLCQVFNRYFYALDSAGILKSASADVLSVPH